MTRTAAYLRSAASVDLPRNTKCPLKFSPNGGRKNELRRHPKRWCRQFRRQWQDLLQPHLVSTVSRAVEGPSEASLALPVLPGLLSNNGEKHALVILEENNDWNLACHSTYPRIGSSSWQNTQPVASKLLYHLIYQSQRLGDTVLEQIWRQLGSCHPILEANRELESCLITSLSLAHIYNHSQLSSRH